MPRNTREYLLRFADESINDLVRALDKLAQIKDAYGDTHPDHRTAVEQIGIIIAQAHELLTAFRQNVM